MAVETLKNSAGQVVEADEEGTLVVVVVWTDEEGSALTPSTLAWSLVDMNGTVINDRESVTVTTPASTESIVLSGDDLAAVGVNRRRRLTLIGTYDSTYGSDLPLTKECDFRIAQYVGVDDG